MVGSWYCQRKTKTSRDKGRGVWGPFDTSLQSVPKCELLQYFWLLLTALRKALRRPPRHSVTSCDDVWLPVLSCFASHPRSLSTSFPNCAHSCTSYVKPKYRTTQHAFQNKTTARRSNCSGEILMDPIIASYNQERYLFSQRMHRSITCGLRICLGTRRQCHRSTLY